MYGRELLRLLSAVGLRLNHGDFVVIVESAWNFRDGSAVAPPPLIMFINHDLYFHFYN